MLFWIILNFSLEKNWSEPRNAKRWVLNLGAFTLNGTKAVVDNESKVLKQISMTGLDRISLNL